MEKIVIKAKNLTKKFGEIVAIDNISFAVPQGKTVALLGGNGAGKTTTISILLGLLIPTSGSLSVLGADMSHNFQPHEVHCWSSIASTSVVGNAARKQ